MDAKQFNRLLARLGACEDAREFCKGKSLREAWDTSERGDWMLWLCGKMVDREGWPTRQELVLAACACARTALKFVPKGEDRPRKAIIAAEKWARGKATLEEVRNAAADDAAYAVAAVVAAAYAATYSSYAANANAADAAYAATYAASAADATAAYDDAYDAVAAAASAADAAARAKALKKCAAIVRKRLNFRALTEARHA